MVNWRKISLVVVVTRQTSCFTFKGMGSKKYYHMLNFGPWSALVGKRVSNGNNVQIIRLYSLRNSMKFYQNIGLAFDLLPSISKRESLYC